MVDQSSPLVLLRDKPGREVRLIQEPKVPGSISGWPHTFVSPSAGLRRTVVNYWRKNVHEVLANRLGGLSLSRKHVVRLPDRPDMI